METPGVLVIAADRIVSMHEGDAGSGATTIDLGDATIMPGLIDCHTHIADFVLPSYYLTLMFSKYRTADNVPEATIYSVRNAQTMLRNGFTTIRGAAPAQYLDNVGAGVKVHLQDQCAIGPSLAVTALVSVPTFPSESHLRTYDGFLTGHASKDVGWLHVDWNVGLTVWRLGDAPLAQGFTALALSTSLPPPFSIALEGYAFSDAAPVAPKDGGLRAVLSMSPRSWLVFDVGGDIGFFPSTRSYSVFVGMTIIPVVWWRT